MQAPSFSERGRAKHSYSVLMSLKSFGRPLSSERIWQLCSVTNFASFPKIQHFFSHSKIRHDSPSFQSPPLLIHDCFVDLREHNPSWILTQQPSLHSLIWLQDVAGII